MPTVSNQSLTTGAAATRFKGVGLGGQQQQQQQLQSVPFTAPESLEATTVVPVRPSFDTEENVIHHLRLRIETDLSSRPWPRKRKKKYLIHSTSLWSPSHGLQWLNLIRRRLRGVLARLWRKESVP